MIEFHRNYLRINIKMIIFQYIKVFTTLFNIDNNVPLIEKRSE